MKPAMHILLGVSLSLPLVLVQAAPKEQGEDHASKGKGQGRPATSQHESRSSGSREREVRVDHARKVETRVRVESNSPVEDAGRVRSLLHEHRAYYVPAAPLPPGIAANVQRGKPLPPGIAKKLDPRLVERLPYYEGYEWRQVGGDIVLVAITTGLVVEILDHLFD